MAPCVSAFVWLFGIKTFLLIRQKNLFIFSIVPSFTYTNKKRSRTNDCLLRGNKRKNYLHPIRKYAHVKLAEGLICIKLVQSSRREWLTPDLSHHRTYGSVYGGSIKMNNAKFRNELADFSTLGFPNRNCQGFCVIWGYLKCASTLFGYFPIRKLFRMELLNE